MLWPFMETNNKKQTASLYLPVSYLKWPFFFPYNRWNGELFIMENLLGYHYSERKNRREESKFDRHSNIHAIIQTRMRETSPKCQWKATLLIRPEAFQINLFFSPFIRTCIFAHSLLAWGVLLPVLFFCFYHLNKVILFAEYFSESKWVNIGLLHLSPQTFLQTAFLRAS